MFCNAFLRGYNRDNEFYNTFLRSIMPFNSYLQKCSGMTYLDFKQAQSNSKVEENLLQDFRSVPKVWQREESLSQTRCLYFD